MFNETQIAQRKNNNPTDKNLGLMTTCDMKNAQTVTAELYLLKKVNIRGGANRLFVASCACATSNNPFLPNNFAGQKSIFCSAFLFLRENKLSGAKHLTYYIN